MWLDRLVIEAMHLDQIRLHGGLPGLRDGHALDAALARPQNRIAYDASADLAALAAAYGFGLVRSHPFVDGNKRVGFLAMYVFLGLDGLEIEAAESEVVDLMVELAAGTLDENQLATWLRNHIA